MKNGQEVTGEQRLLALTEFLWVSSVVLLIGGFIKGAIGFGLPFIATPILVFYLPLSEAVALILLPVLASNLQQCWVTRAAADVLRAVWPMILANFLVLLIGSYLLLGANSELTKIAIATLIMLHALFGDRQMDVPVLNRWRGLAMAGAGVTSGLLGSVTSFFSFPSVQLLHTLKLPPASFVFAIGILLSSGFIALWLGISLRAFQPPAVLAYSLWLVVPTVLGVWFGNLARERLPEEAFRTAVRVMLFATGAGLLLRSLLQIAS